RFRLLGKCSSYVRSSVAKTGSGACSWGGRVLFRKRDQLPPHILGNYGGDNMGDYDDFGKHRIREMESIWNRWDIAVRPGKYRESAFEKAWGSPDDPSRAMYKFYPPPSSEWNEDA
ncbi:MAG: hypothetical protein ABJ360_10430, partial [Roseobacter sp.]